jgi:hypothetical protein
MNRKNVGEPTQHLDCWVVLSPLDPAEIAEVHFRIERELLLREIALLAEPPNVIPDDLFPRHSAH